jgi:hypothetical protein
VFPLLPYLLGRRALIATLAVGGIGCSLQGRWWKVHHPLLVVQRLRQLAFGALGAIYLVGSLVGVSGVGCRPPASSGRHQSERAALAGGADMFSGQPRSGRRWRLASGSHVVQAHVEIEIVFGVKTHHRIPRPTVTAGSTNAPDPAG